MNERIRGLAEHAVKYSLSNVNRDSEFFTPIAMEKFAELIVQECLLAISKTDVTLEEMSVMVKCHTQVEKHFGIE